MASQIRSFVALFLVSASLIQLPQSQRTQSELVKAQWIPLFSLSLAANPGKPVAEGSGFIGSLDGKIDPPTS